MGLISKKRLLLTAGGVSTVAAAATLVAGTTFGLFSASNTSSASSFAAGTVSQGSPANTACAVTNMVPGDSATNACSFAVTYTGSAPAFLALDVAVGGTGLYDGSANGLQLTISDGTASYTTSGVLNGTSDLLVSTTPDAGSSNTVHTFTVSYALPLTAGNTYQSKTTTLTLTVHSVQSGNNNFPSTDTCTAGHICGTATDWS